MSYALEKQGVSLVVVHRTIPENLTPSILSVLRSTGLIDTLRRDFVLYVSIVNKVGKRVYVNHRPLLERLLSETVCNISSKLFSDLNYGDRIDIEILNVKYHSFGTVRILYNGETLYTRHEHGTKEVEERGSLHESITQ